MKINDISVTLRSGMAVWPGEPEVDIYRVSKIEDGENANVTYLGMAVHTGTHVDAPCHFIPGENSVETLPLNVLIGEAIVVQLPDDVEEITASEIHGLAIKPGTERVLFKTRNSRYWLKENEVFEPGFVGLAEDGATALVELGVKLVGIDYLSIAPFKQSRPTHMALLSEKVIILEGLDLSAVEPGKYTLYCLPLKIANGDGAPARVILVED